MKRKTNGKYTINVQSLFRKTVHCQFRDEVNEKGKKTGNTPFTEIMSFVKRDLEDAFLSIEHIAKSHNRGSIKTEDVIEYYGLVGRPQLYKED